MNQKKIKKIRKAQKLLNPKGSLIYDKYGIQRSLHVVSMVTGFHAQMTANYHPLKYYTEKDRYGREFTKSRIGLSPVGQVL